MVCDSFTVIISVQNTLSHTQEAGVQADPLSFYTSWLPDMSLTSFRLCSSTLTEKGFIGGHFITVWGICETFKF
jgi:hypothetical protein